ncbi:Alg5-prov protein [Phellopilus nigrolimitatus]|nr:Alg5-prov protein [Phellopilus nigrolimitatus]
MADVTYLSLMLGVGVDFLGFPLLCACIYAALVLLSPPPIDALPSEKKYRSATSPKTPQDLPDIRTTPTANVDLSIVIPAFNEVPRLPSMLDSTIKHLSKPAYKSRSREIVIVDDGSSDQTTDTALNLAEKYKSWDIRVITLETNIGKGGAVRHGMLYSRGRRLLMVDADGASRFEDLEVLWKEMDRIAPNDEPAVVVGSRAHLVKTEVVVKRSVLRNMAMYALHLTLRLHLKGWIFDVEIILLAKQLQIPVAEVPINWSEIPESKLRLMRDSLFMFRDLLILRANQLTGRWTVPKKLKAQ